MGMLDDKFLQRQALKALMPLVKTNMPAVEEGIANFLESIPLQAEEEFASIILYQTPGTKEANLTLATFDFTNNLKRQLKTIRLSAFLELALSGNMDSLLK